MTSNQIRVMVIRYNDVTTRLRDKLGLSLWKSHSIRGFLSGEEFIDCEEHSRIRFHIAQMTDPHFQPSYPSLVLNQVVGGTDR